MVRGLLRFAGWAVLALLVLAGLHHLGVDVASWLSRVVEWSDTELTRLVTRISHSLSS
jgi:hypothetical protein